MGDTTGVKFTAVAEELLAIQRGVQRVGV